MTELDADTLAYSLAWNDWRGVPLTSLEAARGFFWRSLASEERARYQYKAKQIASLYQICRDNPKG